MGAVFLCSLVLAFVPSANAQQWVDIAPAQIRPTFSALLQPETRTWLDAVAADTSDRRPTHWEKGLLIGGLIGTVGVGAIAYAFCESFSELGESCLTSGLLGAAMGGVVGGTVGALIAGQFPKRNDTVPAPDSSKIRDETR
jgi:hypothetical protein